MQFSRAHIATAIALLFHVCGLAGILWTPWSAWFINNTPLNLALMAALLIWVQEDRNKYFFLFVGISFAAGMLTEGIGVHTGALFGSYHYGKVLGAAIFDVPLLIGVNWFVITYCSAAVMRQVHKWMNVKLERNGEAALPGWLTRLSLVADSALLAVVFDWVMEPVAIWLHFWEWTTKAPPVYNYVCWFVVSLGLQLLLRRLPGSRLNHFAVHLFIIQLLFFMALRTFL